MREQYYRAIGWLCLLSTVGIALSWCWRESGLAGWIMNTSEQYLHTRLVQISWLLTFLILCVPGYLAKGYFDGLAWSEHLRALPPPDPREAARRSKYIQLESALPPPPQPLSMANIPEGQQEFIATCTACGNLFSAKKDSTTLKCPTCGETVSLNI